MGRGVTRRCKIEEAEAQMRTSFLSATIMAEAAPQAFGWPAPAQDFLGLWVWPWSQFRCWVALDENLITANTHKSKSNEPEKSATRRLEVPDHFQNFSKSTEKSIFYGDYMGAPM